jgi:hypothetical protein
MPITYHYAADAANEPTLTTRAHPAWRESCQRADGLLDLSRIACETGFRAPVAISREALGCCLAGLPELRPGRFPSHDAAKRLWTVLWAAAAAALHRHGDTPIRFDAPLDPVARTSVGCTKVQLKLVVDYRRHGPPSATILLPNENEPHEHSPSSG